MIPTKSQYKNWSLPSKWTFWAGIITVISLLLSILAFFPDDEKEQFKKNNKMNKLILQTAQELRYNREWLSELAVAYDEKSKVVPIGKMRVDALLKLANSDFEKIIIHSYGEGKNIYQEIFKLCDLAKALGSPVSINDITRFNNRSKYKLHDVVFLNNFLNWYLYPLIEERLSSRQIYTLGWHSLQNDAFQSMV